MVGERPVGPVPLRRCRVGLDGLVATHLAVGGEVAVAALPAVIPCAVGATLVSIYGGVSRSGMIGVTTELSCDVFRRQTVDVGPLALGQPCQSNSPSHDRSLSRSLGQKRVACRQACRMGDCCSQVDPGRHAKLRRCAECTNGTWNPDDGGSVSAKMDAIEDLTSQMP